MDLRGFYDTGTGAWRVPYFQMFNKWGLILHHVEPDLCLILVFNPSFCLVLTEIDLCFSFFSLVLHKTRGCLACSIASGSDLDRIEVS